MRWRLQAAATADLRGPTTCELLTPPQVDALIERIGPDPLRADADPDRAWRRIHASSAPIATLLMDQTVLGGVGNVYRAEVLFRHGVAPMTAGRRLPKVRWNAMWVDLVALMAEGVVSGRIDTVRPEHEPEAMGRPPRADDHGGEVYVYRRDGMDCWVCGNSVRKRVLGGRNFSGVLPANAPGERRRGYGHLMTSPLRRLPPAVVRYIDERVVSWRTGSNDGQRTVLFVIFGLTVVLLTASLIEYSWVAAAWFVVPMLFGTMTLAHRHLVLLIGWIIICVTLTVSVESLANGMTAPRLSTLGAMALVAGVVLFDSSHRLQRRLAHGG